MEITTKEEQDEIWVDFCFDVKWCIDADGCFDVSEFMGLKEDYIIIRKPKEEANQIK